MVVPDPFFMPLSFCRVFPDTELWRFISVMCIAMRSRETLGKTLDGKNSSLREDKSPLPTVGVTEKVILRAVANGFPHFN